ncbi:hypothetical protein T05_12888 [Trichinella murrelli]|uniref:Uncharacterized protein n=1 Tax=Trichinella murrelli TaxID=144512 RepID=A0A0V0U3Q3_9BILA|nr:hypothetical protein T05_12888 [Trichinella murrelli]
MSKLTSAQADCLSSREYFVPIVITLIGDDHKPEADPSEQIASSKPHEIVAKFYTFLLQIIAKEKEKVFNELLYAMTLQQKINDQN